ncbi:Splicing factor 3B subunit 3 [Kappamyces sp. JEL0680]|nr:Splicing factor 3B subunit 3 [Kappamyces sp. JEL0680]
MIPKPNKDEIKEFHFHVYFDSHQEKEALALADAVNEKRRHGDFEAVLLRINHQPVGPHPTGSYEVWVPKEYFSAAYSFFLLNRGSLSVLVHPLTQWEMLDHTDRATFLGRPYELRLEALSEYIDHVPLQYPELGLGYSAHASQTWIDWIRSWFGLGSKRKDYHWVGLSDLTVDFVVLGTDSGRIAILEWDDEKLTFTRVQCETFGKTGIRRGVPGQYLATDPKGRAVMIGTGRGLMLGAVERAKFVYILNRDAASKLTISSPLDAHRNHTVCFGITGVDVGFENPLFASIEVDFGDADTDPSGKAFAKIEKHLVMHELDLGLNHVLRKWSTPIDKTSHYLIQVPGGADGPSGVLVGSEGWITWYHMDGESVKVPIPTRIDPCDGASGPIRVPIIVSHAVHRMKKQFFILVQSDLGDVFKVTMDYEAGGDGVIGQVQALKIKYFESLSLASSLCLLKSGFLFVAAESGNHILYQIENLGDDEEDQPEFSNLDWDMSKNPDFSFTPRELRNLAPVDQLESISPLTDALVANLTDEDTPQIYAVTGRGGRSAFTILRHGLTVAEIASSELPGYPNAIWTVKGSSQDEYDSYIIISFVNATLVLSIGESVEEVTDTGVLTSTPTLAVGQLGDEALVQIYPGGIRHIRSDRRVSEWKAPKGKTITRGASNYRQVSISLSSGEIVYFELDNAGNLNEFQDRVEMSGSVVSLAMSPIPSGRQRARYLAIGCDDNTVRVLSLDPQNCLETVSMQALGAPADSLAIIEMTDPTTSVASLYLNIGLANGVLLRTTIDNITGVLSDTRQRFLGAKSVKLFPVTIAGSSAVLALSTRPWLSYFYQSKTKLAPLSYEALEYGASFSSEQAPEGIVAIAGNTLRILAVEKLNRLFNQVSIRLKYTPRRLVLHEPSKNFVVIEAEHGTLSPKAVEAALEARSQITEDGSIPDALDPEQFGLPVAPSGTWASCIRLINPFTGDTLTLIDLEENEAAVSVATCLFATHSHEVVLVVGIVKGLELAPRKAQGGALRVYRFAEEGNALELLHQAMCAFQGRILVGVGKLLRIYELGKKKMLRKCESKDFPRNILKIHTQGDRIITADASESIQFAAYRYFDNRIVIFADDPTPRWMTSSHQLDYDTIAGGDKFGTIFVDRLDAEVSKAVEDDSTGNFAMLDRGKMQGAPHKLQTIAAFFLGEGVSSITKTVLVPGGRELILYTTFLGTVGILVAFTSKEDVEFFQLLEMTLRQEIPMLSGRNHLQYRSYYVPCRNVIDGDLCELFNSLPNEKKRMIAEGLDRSVGDVAKKLDDIRNRVAF